MNDPPQPFPLLKDSLKSEMTVTDIDPHEEMKVFSAQLELNEHLPNLVKTEATAILLDLNNFYKIAEYNGFEIDYVSLINIFSRRCNLRYCAGFSAINRTSPEARGWVTFMEKKGYTMITKDLKSYVNKKGEAIQKGNMDINLTIEAMSLSSGFAHVIIGTCDGDFIPLIEKLKEDSFRKVSVMGITSYDSTNLDIALKNSGDNFYDLSAIRKFISLPERNR